jgi:hypothetical protein
MSTGRPEAAIDPLRRAREYQETSLPARCELAMAYVELGQIGRYPAFFREFRDVTPETAEDCLFLGRALQLDAPARSVELLRRSLELHDSPLTRMTYALTLCSWAVRQTDSELALRTTHEALREVGQAANLLGKDRPYDRSNARPRRQLDRRTAD